ncbi:AGP2 [Candida pseudojiufengensis]|uniref:AGP2 n=1 Tax=Candida pseudojiufengensis TaxID=497109 RepID=UPI0022255991|nr:AGP2 [Candida pseudojiufengensis]KAI5962128.1 AGP2 [Candida pseudojiufengensis]
MWFTNSNKEKDSKEQFATTEDFTNTSSNNSISLQSSKPPIAKQDVSRTQRKLHNRHIQLIAIGGSIGTGLYVTIGTTGLVNGGPLGLLLSYCISTLLTLLLTTAMGEIVCYAPFDSPFLNMAGRVVDESFEVAASVNFWLMQALYVPFEITAVNTIIHFWRDDYSPAITLCIQIAIYAAINLYAVRIFGEFEFACSLLKLLLCIGLIIFTIVSMCGGVKGQSAFGFQNWHYGLFATNYATGRLGQFQGFLTSLRMSSSFTCVGSEYLSMTAGEAVNPRKTLPIAYRTVLYRLVVFYIGGALCVSILVRYNDPGYVNAASNSGSSPYVYAARNLGINALPDIINAVVLTSAFSAGCSYTYTSSRSMYNLALKGYIPKFFKICTSRGIPIYCVFVSICFSLLSLLQLSSSSAKVLNYMVNLCTGSQLLNYGFMCIIYIGFYRATKAQGIDRSSFTYRSWFQPYSIYFVTIIYWCIIGILGYPVFMPGNWSTDDFLFSYVMIFVSLAVFLSWKIIKRTKFIKPIDADLTSGLDEIEAHEFEYYQNLKSKNGKEGDEESDLEEKRSIFKRIMDWLF